MVQIIIVNGMPTSGKSTFVEYCLKELGCWGREISTVDFVKDIAKQAGWNGEKNLKNRKFLSDLKDLLTEWDDVPYKKIKQAYDAFNFELAQYDVSHHKAFLFVHCREPQEIQKFKDRLNAVTVLIRREAVESNEQSNHADSEVFNFKYDAEITNNESLRELKEKAKGFIELMTI